MKEHYRVNLLTGGFVVAVLLAIAGTTIFLQDMQPKVKGERYFLVFDDAPGIAKGSPVLVGGKRVGAVDNIEVKQEQVAAGTGQTRLATRAVITVVIESQYVNDIAIYDNASASVATSLFGSSSVNFYPGGPSSDIAAQKLKPDARIMGISPIGFDDIARQSSAVLKNLEGITAEIREFVSDETRQKNVAQGIDRTVKLIDELGVLIEKIGPMLDKAGPMLDSGKRTFDTIEQSIGENRASIKEILDNARDVSVSAKTFTDQRLGKLADSLEGLATDVSELTRNANLMLGENRQTVNETLANVRDTAAYLRDAAEKLRRDPSIVLFGTDKDDNAADRKAGEKKSDEFALRDSGRLPPRERD